MGFGRKQTNKILVQDSEKNDAFSVTTKTVVLNNNNNNSAET